MINLRSIVIFFVYKASNLEGLTPKVYYSIIYSKSIRKEGRQMTAKIPTREEALELFKRYNKSESLIRHALAVEATMKHFAELFKEPDVHKWSIVGLIHDLDYEMYPDEHCIKVQEILKEEGYPEDYIRAVASHGYGICCDIEPVERMEKVLYAIDELTGLITAVALLRPSRSVLDLEPKSVKKKWKDKSFAAGVDRKIIEKGIEMLGMERDEVIRETILAMRKVAEEIGLKGNL